MPLLSRNHEMLLNTRSNGNICCEFDQETKCTYIKGEENKFLIFCSFGGVGWWGENQRKQDARSFFGKKNL